MVCQIIGIKAFEGTSKKTGRSYDAYVLHTVVQNSGDEDLKGHEVKQQFIDKKFLLDDVKRLGGYSALVGQVVDIMYNDRGFVESVMLLEQSGK